MTDLLIKIKRSFPGLWKIIEMINGCLISIRYPKLHKSANEILSSVRHQNFNWSLVTESDIQELSQFLNSMPDNRLPYFKPHKFDASTLHRMVKNRSFLMMKVTSGENIIGYHFLRCFFVGKAFHGLIVDDCHNGLGIGTKMWSIATEICHKTGILMFATISENNKASLSSCQKGCHAIITDRLSNGYILIRCESNYHVKQSNLVK